MVKVNYASLQTQSSTRRMGQGKTKMRRALRIEITYLTTPPVHFRPDR